MQENTITKVCKTCGIRKPVTRDYFGQISGGPFRAKCRLCMNAFSKQYDSANPDSVRRRSARRQKLSSRWKPDDDLKQILFDAQGKLCGLCGELLPSQLLDSNYCQVDHLIPVAQGGDNQEENLILTHRQCNQEKASKNFLEYIVWRERAGLARSTYSSEKLYRCLSKLC